MDWTGVLDWNNGLLEWNTGLLEWNTGVSVARDAAPTRTRTLLGQVEVIRRFASADSPSADSHSAIRRLNHNFR